MPSDQTKTGATGSNSDIVLRLGTISKSFGRVAALSDVSVAFHAGEVHAVLGENGAGKSTLMNIIKGVFKPTRGQIEVMGKPIAAMTPEISASLGIAIAFQHPAVLSDLSVLENLRVALPDALFEGTSAQSVGRALLDGVGLHVPLEARADTLSVAQLALLEIAKALAIKPRVLILDEPTASLDQDATDMLFERIRDLVAAGTAVIYITHRMAEVRQIAQRVTVLRDGRKRGEALVRDVSDQDLLAMIVGRALGSTFPPKADETGREINLSVRHLSGPQFKDISFDVARGQILGVAGVAGNGQSELMRALAGLLPWQGEVELTGSVLTSQEILHKAAFMPSDRQAEGLASGLTIRENASLAALSGFARFGFVNRKRELEEVAATFQALAVKAPGIEAATASLSGGNQQKVVMARALLSQPGLIVADEPTQGVDVGARAEIYRILRDVSSKGTPVIVNSSDAAELEGLCDSVIVLSRGKVVATLTGADVTEAKIVAAAVSAGSHAEVRQDQVAAQRSGWRHFVQTDNAPVIPLAVVIVLLGLYGFSQNTHFLSAYNVANMLMLATALGFIAMGQNIALLLGGIDLSVGPLAGFMVVVASFFINDGQSGLMILAGFALMLAAGVGVGLINGVLIRFANFTPIAATLAMYIGLQGCSFLLRNGPDGYINSEVVAWITWEFGAIPVAFIVLVAVALGGEYLLRQRRLGWQLRAVGSNEESARRIGVHIDRMYILGYLGSALFTAMGAVMLMAQIGVGDPQQGVNYTLSSITAVVLGGTSLKGGRGTFIGTVMGAILLMEVLNAVAFLGLSQTWQYVFQGALILIAAVVYSTLRNRAAANP